MYLCRCRTITRDLISQGFCRRSNCFLLCLQWCYKANKTKTAWQSLGFSLHGPFNSQIGEESACCNWASEGACKNKRFKLKERSPSESQAWPSTPCEWVSRWTTQTSDHFYTYTQSHLKIYWKCKIGLILLYNIFSYYIHEFESVLLRWKESNLIKFMML